MRNVELQNDVVEVFDGVSNIDFKDLSCCTEVQAELPVFTLSEPSVEEWNQKAMLQNTRMFTEITGRQAVNNQEVLNWIYARNAVIAG